MITTMTKIQKRNKKKASSAYSFYANLKCYLLTFLFCIIIVLINVFQNKFQDDLSFDLLALPSQSPPSSSSTSSSTTTTIPPPLSSSLSSSKNGEINFIPTTPNNNELKWQLWQDMDPMEQKLALEKAMARAKPYGKMLGGEKDTSKFHNTCNDGNKPQLMGKGGEHMVCGPKPDKEKGCKFLSFGIRDDPSWDIHMGDAWNCRGFSGDPSITHPSKLHAAVTFANVGLKMLRTNVEQRVDPQDEWILTSLPKMQQFLTWDYIDIVKIDCEGCEVAMARDILADDPSFLSKIGQISIETHATRTWVNTTEELYYYALQFPLLEDAGFKLIWSSVFGCGRHEHDGCMTEMKTMSMSCGNRMRNNVNYVPIGFSCHDWLWQRI